MSPRSAILVTLLALGLNSQPHAAAVHLEDIVGTPTGVMDFEEAPDGMSGAVDWVEGDMRIVPIHRDPFLDIWTTSGPGNGRSWYPDAGDDGSTRIRRADNTRFDTLSFFGGSGYLQDLQTLHFEPADNGAVVLSGTLDASFGGSWFGFSGGDFNELRFRATRGQVTSLDDCPPQDRGNRCNYAWADDIRMGSVRQQVPAPGSLALVLAVGMAGWVVKRRIGLRRGPWSWLGLTVLGAAALGPASAQQRAIPSQPLNPVLFEEQVRAALGGRVKAYALAVSDRRGIVARAAAGWGQDPADGRVPMSSTLPSGVGSVSKMLSGTALLHVFEARARNGSSVAAQLDAPIWPQLPPQWRTAYVGKGWETVSYRRLLQHRAGVANTRPGCVVQSAESSETLVNMERGIAARQAGRRCYANFNYKLLRFLIPALAYPDEVQALYEQHQSLDLPAYTEQLNLALSLLYERYLREQLLPRSIDPLVATCRPQRDLGERGAAKSYPTRDSSNGRYIATLAQERSPEHFCATQGSWYLSAEGLALFGRNLVYTDRWLSPGTRAQLWQANSADDRLPWAGTTTVPGQGAWPSHGGDQGNYQAALLMLPGGHVGGAVVNSDEVSSGELARTLAQAFAAASTDVSVARARHGLTLAEYQRFATDMDRQGSRMDWVDFYNVGNEVFVNLIMRPAGQGPRYRVRHGLSAAQYQAEVDTHVTSGRMHLRLVDSYMQAGAVRYAYIMAPGSGQGVPAYHGADAATHQRLFERYTAQGLRPSSVSVVSHQGRRQYATTWTRHAGGGLMVRSTLDAAAYQQLAEDMADKQMALVYLNTHRHDNKLYYSAVFTARSAGPQLWRHGLSALEYQGAFNDRAEEGWALQLVAGAGVGNQHRYAAVWER